MSFLDEIRKIPPVTRFLCGSTLAVSIPVMLKVVSPYTFLFHRESVTIRGEIWRPFTSLFYGGSGLNFLFDFIMLYRNSSGLESMQFAGNSADYAWQLLLTTIGILTLNLPLRSVIHFRPLLLSIVYFTSRLSPDSVVSIFGLLSVRNIYFPFALLAMDYIMGGSGMAACSVTGLVAGHAWWYLFHDLSSGGVPRGGALGTAPSFLKNLFEERGGPAPPTAPGSSGFRVVPAAQRRPAAPMTGYNWGTGHRLGSG